MLDRTRIVALLLFALAGTACQQSAPSKAAASPGPSPVERGKYLVWTGGCNDCHTPKKMGAGGMPELDTTRLLAGTRKSPSCRLRRRSPPAPGSQSSRGT